MDGQRSTPQAVSTTKNGTYLQLRDNRSTITPARVPSTAALLTGNDLEKVTVRVLEINAAAAVVLIDLAQLCPARPCEQGEVLKSSSC